MKQHSGFTLIEIMIVIALIAFLALTVSPIGGSWVRSADVQKTEGNLTEAIGRAKAGALRNPSGVVGELPVTAICISDNLVVLQSTDNNPPNCTGLVGRQLWRTTLDAGVQITASSTSTEAISCACFNNKGLLSSSDTCSSCASNTTFYLSAGSKNATVSIH